MADLIVSREEYKKYNIYAGAQTKIKEMERFMYGKRSKVNIFDVQKVNDRIIDVAKFLSNFKKILIVGRDRKAHIGIKNFSKWIKAEALVGRYMPGTLTNPSYENFFEPDVVMVNDPVIDFQAVREAVSNNIPVVALCNTNSPTGFADVVLPCNNSSKASIDFVYWLLARETLKIRGETKLPEIKDFVEEIETPSRPISINPLVKSVQESIK